MTNPAAGQPTREDLAETFVTLADTLVDDYDIVELFDRLVKSCVDMLGATAAALLLDTQQDTLALVASSSEASQLLEIFQLQTNEGPCLDCIHTGTSIVIDDLALVVDRWPQFVPAAQEAGFQSVVAVPMRLRTEVIGGLNLFAAEPTIISPVNRRIAQALADVATIGIIQQRTTHRSSMVAEQLQGALNSRIVIEQAKGIIAERHELTVEQAFGVLRQYSRSSNTKMTIVASKVIKGELDPTLT